MVPNELIDEEVGKSEKMEVNARKHIVAQGPLVLFQGAWREGRGAVRNRYRSSKTELKVFCIGVDVAGAQWVLVAPMGTPAEACWRT